MAEAGSFSHLEIRIQNCHVINVIFLFMSILHFVGLVLWVSQIFINVDNVNYQLPSLFFFFFNV